MLDSSDIGPLFSAAGHVGVPLACCMMKVVDVPEMDYYAKNQEGEVK